MNGATFLPERVTPSRVCELKLLYLPKTFFGCVTPSRVCELKLYYFLPMDTIQVTPSRVCELKSGCPLVLPVFGLSHPHGCVS